MAQTPTGRTGQGARQGTAGSYHHLPLRDATRTIDSMTHPPTRPPLGPGTRRSCGDPEAS
jgi:hypothetical protein